MQECVLVLNRHGIAVDRPTVEQEMRDRIADIADRLGVDPQTVLRDHASPAWGRQMAEDVIAQLDGQVLLDAPAPAATSG